MFEFMAAGAPLVASDQPVVREVLKHGQDAWLVEPGNPTALADGLALSSSTETFDSASRTDLG